MVSLYKDPILIDFFLTYLTQSGLVHFPAAEALQRFGMNVALSAFSKLIILRQSLECVPSAPNFRVIRT